MLIFTEKQKMKKNIISNIESLIVNKLNLSIILFKEIKRFIIAFFCAWFCTILINDFLFVHINIESTGFIKLLTKLIVSSTESIINFIGFETYSNFKHLRILQTPGVRFELDCLGLRPLTIFFIFILAYYGNFWKKFPYIILGFFFLNLANVIRSVIIVISQIKHADNFQVIHDVTSPIFMYPTILFLWLIWISSFGKPTK